MVTESEKFAAKLAWANAKLEGFEPTQEQTELMERFVNEEISGDEYLRIVVERARETERKNLAAKKLQRVA
ncbi:MAG: hypothetical protein LBI31_01120 [Zoogloeaceae bacterium]|jgi:hypothetical protein|nr:hypothetical protein [Zoogloeaceae bacterium]